MKQNLTNVQKVIDSIIPIADRCNHIQAIKFAFFFLYVQNRAFHFNILINYHLSFITQAFKYKFSYYYIVYLLSVYIYIYYNYLLSKNRVCS